MKAYMDYICDTLLTKDTGILMSDQIDKNDATYIAWAKDETINLYTYLNYAISKNWIDTSKLGSSSYSSSEEIYQEILKYLKEYLADDNIDILTVLTKSGLAASRSEARRNVEQGGVSVDGTQIKDIKAVFAKDQFAGDGVVVKRGKKNFKKVILK